MTELADISLFNSIAGADSCSVFNIGKYGLDGPPEEKSYSWFDQERKRLRRSQKRWNKAFVSFQDALNDVNDVFTSLITPKNHDLFPHAKKYMDNLFSDCASLAIRLDDMSKMIEDTRRRLDRYHSNIEAQRKDHDPGLIGSVRSYFKYGSGLPPRYVAPVF